MARFRLIKTSPNGQEASLYINAKNINTERGLMQHRREDVLKLMDFKAGDSIVAEVVKVIGYQV